jgi:acyl-CoA dehydrogenase
VSRCGNWGGARGGWIVSGVKIWTSGAHRAHALIALVRTSPADGTQRHVGLSQLLIELDQPGVTIRPIISMTGEHHFNEVLFSDVFVPDGQVVGTIGAGWAQVTSELAYERSGPDRNGCCPPSPCSTHRSASSRRGIAA